MSRDHEPLIPLLAHTPPQDWARQLQLALDTLDEAGRKRLDGLLFLQLACMLADANIRGQDAYALSGGPFGAVLVRYDEQGTPVILAAAANAVVAERDPSAHAEMQAIRQAAAKQGYSDLSDVVLYSSCECCPQCQAAATSVGITKVHYAVNRYDADAIGFSDEAQYRLITNYQQMMTALDNVSEVEKKYLEAVLTQHEAAVLDADGQVIAAGNAETQPHDPFASLASMQAIRAACRKLGLYHLPEGFRLVSRLMPHPAAFVTADWAQIGRSAATPEVKNPLAIIYATAQIEELCVITASDEVQCLISAEAVLADMLLTPAERKLLPAIQCDDEMTLHYAKTTFAYWQQLAQQYETLRY